MKTFRTMLCIGTLLLSGTAVAQSYGPPDEGRRFNDGSKVVCKNVEVQRNSKDSNRILGTATGAVVAATSRCRRGPPGLLAVVAAIPVWVLVHADAVPSTIELRSIVAENAEERGVTNVERPAGSAW